MDADAASLYIEQGFTLITVGMDILFLGKSAEETLRELRR
jgi:2-dehydro-3-deoxyglucarate aldolase/4-hydroxy-2-oxoheptanedioate aldolase